MQPSTPRTPEQAAEERYVAEHLHDHHPDSIGARSGDEALELARRQTEALYRAEFEVATAVREIIHRPDVGEAGRDARKAPRQPRARIGGSGAGSPAVIINRERPGTSQAREVRSAEVERLQSAASKAIDLGDVRGDGTHIYVRFFHEEESLPSDARTKVKNRLKREPTPQPSRKAFRAAKRGDPSLMVAWGEEQKTEERTPGLATKMGYAVYEGPPPPDGTDGLPDPSAIETLPLTEIDGAMVELPTVPGGGGSPDERLARFFGLTLTARSRPYQDILQRFAAGGQSVSPGDAIGFFDGGFTDADLRARGIRRANPDLGITDSIRSTPLTDAAGRPVLDSLGRPHTRQTHELSQDAPGYTELIGHDIDETAALAGLLTAATEALDHAAADRAEAARIAALPPAPPAAPPAPPVAPTP